MFFFLFRQRFSHFRHKCCFFARPPLIFASLYVLISDRARAFRYLDFDEQCRDSVPLTRTGPISEPGVQSRTDGTPGQS
jgi:hypothetical protein